VFHVTGVQTCALPISPGETLLHTPGRHERGGLAAARATPALSRQRDVTALEQPVFVVLIILERPHRALGAHRAVAVASINRITQIGRASCREYLATAA